MESWLLLRGHRQLCPRPKLQFEGEALRAEIARVKDGKDFMETQRALADRDREILNRLAE
jgi:hypothetical protein